MRITNKQIATVQVSTSKTGEAKESKAAASPEKPQASTAQPKPPTIAASSDKMTKLGDLKLQASSQQLLLAKTPLKNDVSKLFPDVKLETPFNPKGSVGPCYVTGPCDAVGPCDAIGPCGAVGPCNAVGPCD